MIKGNRVGLRAVERKDLPLLKGWRNIEKFRKNFREVNELNNANQNSWFDKICVDNKDNYMFVIVRLSDNKPIGACGLLYIDWIIRSADFSFYIGINKSYIDNKGWAYEASKLLINYGFYNLNLNKIWMELYEFDKLKYKFYTKKFGFRKDGKLRENCFENGKYYDSYIISLLRNEYINKVKNDKKESI